MAIGADLTSGQPIEETLSTAKQRFVQCLSSAARRGIGKRSMLPPLATSARISPVKN